MDCPENVASYIHRVGRTARYKSDGKSVLFLLPSEIQMLEKLKAAKVPVHFNKVQFPCKLIVCVQFQFSFEHQGVTFKSASLQCYVCLTFAFHVFAIVDYSAKARTTATSF